MAHDNEFEQRVPFGLINAQMETDEIEGPLVLDPGVMQTLQAIIDELLQYAQNYDPERRTDSVARMVSSGYRMNLDIDWEDPKYKTEDLFTMIEPVEQMVEKVPGTDYFVAVKKHEEWWCAELVAESHDKSREPLFTFDAFNCKDEDDALALLAGLRQLNTR